MDLLKTYIRVLVEEELRTKTGEPIEIRTTEDSEGDKNRGWTVHKFEAVIDGETAGYLKVSYIPEERFKRHYKNIFDYIDKITGKAIPKDYSDRKKALNTLAYSILGWPGLDRLEPSLEELDDEDLDRIEKDISKEAVKKHWKAFEEFKDHWVDKPVVDFIFVETGHRRKRIAVALYEFAAKWLAQRGMKLHASGLQSDNAMAAWEWLGKNKRANIGTVQSLSDKSRTFLSYL